MKAGILHHRVDIQEPITVQDEHGDSIVSWTDIWSNVPAAITPVTGREFMESQGVVGQVTARIIIRRLRGIHPEMRVAHRTTIGSPSQVDPDYYNIVAVLPDPTDMVFLTLMCSREVNAPLV